MYQCQAQQDVYDIPYVRSDIRCPPMNNPLPQNSGTLYQYSTSPIAYHRPVHPCPSSLNHPHECRFPNGPGHSGPPSTARYFQSPHHSNLHSGPSSTICPQRTSICETRPYFADPRTVLHRLDECRQSHFRIAQVTQTGYHASPNASEHACYVPNVPLSSKDRYHIVAPESHMPWKPPPRMLNLCTTPSPKHVVRQVAIAANLGRRSPEEGLSELQVTHPRHGPHLSDGPLRRWLTPCPPCSSPDSQRTIMPSEDRTATPVSVATAATSLDYKLLKPDMEDSWHRKRAPDCSQSIWGPPIEKSMYAAIVAGFADFSLSEQGEANRRSFPGRSRSRKDAVAFRAKGATSETTYWCILLEADLVARRVQARQVSMLAPSEQLEGRARDGCTDRRSTGIGTLTHSDNGESRAPLLCEKAIYIASPGPSLAGCNTRSPAQIPGGPQDLRWPPVL